MVNCPDPSPERAPVERVIVRRGRFYTFELLRRTFSDEPRIEIIWDRRQTERRQKALATPDDRRQWARRSRPPDQWDQLNYMVITLDGGGPRRLVRTDPLR